MRQQIVHSLFVSLLLTLTALPCAWTQTGEAQTANYRPPAKEILAARIPYTQHADLACCSGGDQPLSELAQRSPLPLLPPQMRYPRRRGYGGMWRQPGNGRHALIGALIGFGIGAALGAKANQDRHARVLAPILFGGGGALIGAGIGASHP